MTYVQRLRDIAHGGAVPNDVAHLCAELATKIEGLEPVLTQPTGLQKCVRDLLAEDVAV